MRNCILRGCSIRKVESSLGQKSKLREERSYQSQSSQQQGYVQDSRTQPAALSTQLVSQAAAIMISLLAGCSLVTLALGKQRWVSCKFEAGWNLVKTCLKTKQASLGSESLNYIPLIQQQTCWIQDKTTSPILIPCNCGTQPVDLPLVKSPHHVLMGLSPVPGMHILRKQDNTH